MLAWDDFRLVKAVADAGSLAGASEALLVNTSTVFRRLGALEGRLGARLFERKRGGYSLTPAGEEMVRLATRMSDDVITFERQVAGQDLKPSGELRVTTNDALIAYVLTELFAKFRLAFPDIRLDVVSSNVALNLSRRDADIAIRATESPPETLVGRRVSEVAWAIYGADTEPGAAAFDDLLDRNWVLPGENMMLSRRVRTLREQVPPERQVYALSTVMGLGEAIRAGIGVGPLPCFVGETLKLKKFFPLDGLGVTSLWILTHPDIRNSARVRAFLDFVGGALIQMRPRFEGRA